jgi:thiol-disulfide isomerase/thioredoxin
MTKFFAGAGLWLWLCVAWAADLPPQPTPGEIPPDALGRDRAGNEIRLSQHKGKVVIVSFWASWCGPCRRELPVLGEVQKAVGRDHLEVIAVNYKESRRDFVNVIRANKDVDLTYVHDSRGNISDSYGVETLPNMFVVAADGRVAHVHRGYSAEMLEGFIKEILQLLPPEVLTRPAGKT